jgi:hypothetical protein
MPGIYLFSGRLIISVDETKIEYDIEGVLDVILS